jgi:hypothetical protein
MYLRVYDIRDSSHQTPPSSSLSYSITHPDITLPTPTLLTITYTQVLWFLHIFSFPGGLDTRDPVVTQSRRIDWIVTGSGVTNNPRHGVFYSVVRWPHSTIKDQVTRIGRSEFDPWKRECRKGSLCPGDSWYKYRGISGDIPRGLDCSFVLYLEPNLSSRSYGGFNHYVDSHVLCVVLFLTWGTHTYVEIFSYILNIFCEAIARIHCKNPLRNHQFIQTRSN